MATRKGQLMNFTARVGGLPASMPRRVRRGAVAAAVLATTFLPLAPAAASPAAAAVTVRTSTAQVADSSGARHLTLHAMPHGSIAFGRGRRHHLIVGVSVYGLTPGSSHAVDLRIPHHFAVIRFSTLTAASSGQAHATLSSRYAGPWPRGSQLVIRMGAGSSRLDRTPIAVTRRLRHAGRHHRLIAVEVSPHGVSYGTPRGAARLVLQPAKAHADGHRARLRADARTARGPHSPGQLPEPGPGQVHADRPGRQPPRHRAPGGQRLHRQSPSRFRRTAGT